MRRWLILGVTGVIVASLWCLLAGETAGAVDSDEKLYPWLSTQAPSILSRGVPGAERGGCSTKSERILFRDGYSVVACIYGEALLTRVASYTNQGGLAVIGIAYPGENQYSEIYGVCEGSRFCAYSASRDTLVDSGTGKFYTSFVKNLEKQTNPINGLPYYHFARSDLSRHISVGQPMIFNAAAVSMNGKWAVVEAYEYGFVRVDLDTFHERRIAISGARYGVANDPSFELAISNSGREFVVAGYRTGISLYQIDNYCGDVLGGQSMYYFMNPSVPCRQASISTDLFTGFISAHTPSLNASGTRLALTVKTTAGTERIVVAPLSTIPIEASASQYLALGDSYSSGEGETNSRFYKTGTDQETNKCHLSSRSYPYLLIPLWGADTGRSIACSGAQIEDITGIGEYYGQKGQVSKLGNELESTAKQAVVDFMPGIVRQMQFVEAYQPRVVTVGIGGNDAGLMAKLNSCISLGVCEWAKEPAKRIASAKEIQALYAPLRAMIMTLRATNPGATLLFIGYPTIINESSSATCGLLMNSLLSPEERQFMDESIKVLNDTIRSASSAEGVSYIDIQDALVGHRLCEGDALAMNGIRTGNDIAPFESLPILKLIGAESFHPTPFGHALIANRILEQVPSLSDSLCVYCDGPTRPAELSNYWINQTTGTEAGHLSKKWLLEKETYVPTETAHITVPPYSFSPGTGVKVQFGSNTTPNDGGVAGLQGDFSYELTIPEKTEGGYHTVHLVGSSWSGDLVDIYQVISVSGVNRTKGLYMDTSNASNLKNTPESKVYSPEHSVAQIVPSSLGTIATSFAQVKGITDGFLKQKANLTGESSAKEVRGNAASIVILIIAGALSVCVTVFLGWRYIIRALA